MQRDFGVVACISSDFRSISVDDFIFARRVNRYRFSLAHEVAHVVIHQDVFRGVRFGTTSEWKRFVADVDDSDRAWLETQAYWFAGCALVPPAALVPSFAEAKGRAQSYGLDVDRNWVAAEDYVCDFLGRAFQVSRDVVAKQLRLEHLV